MNHRGATNAEQALAHVDALPTLPAIAVELLRLTLDDAGRIDDMVARIKADQALATRLLSAANSPALGAGGSVRSLDDAVVRLGMRRLRNMVLAVKVFEAFDVGERTTFPRVEFWRHTLAVAVASQSLAEGLKLDAGLREHAFIGGILHDIGKLALQTIYPRGYERVVEAALAEHADIADHERAILGIDHTQAGRWLAERWNLPGIIRDVIWLHHVAAPTVEISPGQRLAGVVRLADTLVREQRLGFSGNHDLGGGSSEQAAALGVSPELLEQTTRGLFEQTAAYANLLGIDRNTTNELYLTSLSRANSELGRLNAELIESNSRLAVAARYLRGMTHFDQRISARSSGSEVVAALASAARLVLEQSGVLAFTLAPRGDAIDLAVATALSSECRRDTRPMTPELRAWLSQAGRDLAPAGRSPAEALLAMYLDVEREQSVWALPVVLDDAAVGAILFAATPGSIRALSHEGDELRSLQTSMGLAVGRAQARAAAQRLSEDLAEANRRLQQAQSEVLRSRMVNMIADVAMGAGHVLNNPLAVISGRAQLLSDQLNDPAHRRSLDMIREKAHECSRIVTDLMQFAQPPKPDPQRLAWAEFLRDVHREWLHRSGQSPQACVLHHPREARHAQAVAWADREQIADVLRELLENARFAIEEARAQSHAHGPGRIEVRWRVIEAGLSGPTSGGAKAWIETTINDNGVGMPPHVLQRAFTPFFSSRPAGRGRGLGLARSFRAVEANMGRIWLDSRAGGGTVVFVLVPIAPSDVPAPR